MSDFFNIAKYGINLENLLFDLTKIIKFGAVRRPILMLKCTKFKIGWGSAPDSTRRAHCTPPIL